MTLDEALELHVGDHVASPADNPAWRVRRVTDVWINAARSLVRVSLAGYRAGEWISPFGFMRCPPAAHYVTGDVVDAVHRQPIAEESPT